MVKVYIVDSNELNNKALYERAYSLLDSDRKAKVDKVASASSKNVSTSAGLLLKYALAKEGITEYKVLTNSNGKPYIENIVHFSISHSDNMCIVGISNEQIGVDIEKSESANVAIARRFFTENEAVCVEESDDAKKLFYKFWTLKEAAIKNQGLNIGYLDKFDFSKYKDEEEFSMTVDNIEYFYKHFIEGSFHISISSLDRIKLELIRVGINDLI